MNKRVCLGKIVSAHGVKGLVKILPFGDGDPRLIETLGPFETEGGILKISLKNQAGKYWLASVEGVNERNGAEALRGTGLWVHRGRLPEIEDAHYHADLIGLKALDASGARIGEVIDVRNFGAGDLLEIRPQNGEAYYLPFNETCAPLVDLAAGTITINPEGYEDGA